MVRESVMSLELNTNAMTTEFVCSLALNTNVIPETVKEEVRGKIEPELITERNANEHQGPVDVDALASLTTEQSD